MSWFRQDPKLPPGDIGRLLVGNTFTFHDSAQTVILDSLRKYPNTPIVRLKVINRNVGLVLEHKLAQEILETTRTKFSHRDAYTQLLAAFYPEPNLLLEDEWDADHRMNRGEWQKHMDGMAERYSTEDVHAIIRRHRKLWKSPVDLYKACKDLSHELVFHLFLGIDSTDKQLYAAAVEATDTALHGQFSAPFRVGFGGYESTYSRGLQAQARMNELVSDQVQAHACPFLHPPPDVSQESIESHMSIFSSSLVVKALASCLTFALLQYSRSPDSNIHHLLLESERLASPIIGLLRKVSEQPWTPTPDLRIPDGWDVWVYFPLINRSVEVYGKDARLFRPERWQKDLPEPITFGGGARRCLGINLVRNLVKDVLRDMTTGMRISVGEVEPSVKDFLGWELGDEEQKWLGIKQLPVQRPRQRITARLVPV